MASRIGPDIRITGGLVASEDLVIAGVIEGPVTVLGALTIERGAEIHGEVCARDVVLHGELRVPLRATASVRLGPTAVLCADLQAARLIVEEGAILEGQVRTTRTLDATLQAPLSVGQIQASSSSASRGATVQAALGTAAAPAHSAVASVASPPTRRGESTPPPVPPPDPPPRVAAVAAGSSSAAPTQKQRSRPDEPRRAERERFIPELPTIGRQKLVRR